MPQKLSDTVSNRLWFRVHIISWRIKYYRSWITKHYCAVYMYTHSLFLHTFPTCVCLDICLACLWSERVTPIYAGETVRPPPNPVTTSSSLSSHCINIPSVCLWSERGMSNFAGETLRFPSSYATAYPFRSPCLNIVSASQCVCTMYVCMTVTKGFTRSMREELCYCHTCMPTHMHFVYTCLHTFMYMFHVLYVHVYSRITCTCLHAFMYTSTIVCIYITSTCLQIVCTLHVHVHVPPGNFL